MADVELASDVVDFLNDLVEVDGEAVEKLFECHVPCNKGLADHPTVQVAKQHGGWKVGMLGLLNGLVGKNEAGYGPIEMMTSNGGVVRGFRLAPWAEEQRREL
ncbi:MAG: hypothetical protein WC277_04680 [Bacilli bacterium]